MASLLAGGIVRDQNLNVHFNGVSVGKPNALKSQRNRGLGTRKPLGDLSNATTPASTLASKKQNSKNVSFVEEINGSAGKKKNEKAPKAARKALSDISNSGKPQPHHTSKKNQNNKLSVLSEESIADEMFLHNHHECVKSRTKAIDMDEFLTTIGLDSGLHKPITSPLPSKSKLESPLKYLEFDEMDEPSLEDQFMLETEFSHILHSPPPCRTPKSSASRPWDVDSFSFVLMETPKLSKR